jgi:hypothetical protein
VVYGAALEKRSPVIPERGFESHPLRQPTLKLRLASQIHIKATAGLSKLRKSGEQAGKPDKRYGGLGYKNESFSRRSSVGA